ncbi:DNA methyltransferase [Ureaplasma diversum]|uniref:DNA methyltransferase n=1 Tax=Ureaplasma diversum TaxID=42094 RepID=UPI000AC0CDAC|nr:site-specific DNA-methyltransferase [Ureaplasma diversum]
MKNRLELAKRLLADDGVIFVQSDDNEQAYLKVLMDEVFGRNNFYGMLIQLKGNTQNDSKTIQRNHEYIHVYVKNYHDLLLTYTNYVEKEVFKDEYHLKNKEDFSLTENKSTNRKNPEYIAHYYEGNENGATGNNNRLIDRPNLGYTIYYYEGNENGIIENNKLIDKNNLGYNDFKVFKKGNNIIHAVALADHDVSNLTINSNENEIYMTDDYLKSLGYKIIRPPKRSGNVLGCWTWGIQTKFKEYWNNDQILIKNNKNVIKKEFVDRSEIFVKNDKQYVLRPALLPIQSVVNISSASGTTHLKKLFDKTVFKNPKSENLIQTILSSCTKPNDLVLDFFLGSGTTAATAHKMGRRYIGVEQMGYIKDVVIERMKKVTNGEQGGISKSVKWNGGGNFVYLELKEDAQELIEKVKDATDENINQIKELILKDDRIVPYVFSADISSLDEEFNTLNLNEQKQALIKLIDKNKLYVNYSSIEDAEYNISENDKNFNKAFYGDK